LDIDDAGFRTWGAAFAQDKPTKLSGAGMFKD
jgi:hypothetical protein